MTYKPFGQTKEPNGHGRASQGKSGQVIWARRNKWNLGKNRERERQREREREREGERENMIYLYKIIATV